MEVGDRILRESERRAKMGTSASTQWRQERRGEAPRRIKIAPNISGWLESEVDAWIAERAAARETIPQPAPLKEAAEKRREPAGAAP